MVGAIDFLRDWIGICQASRCSKCELFNRGVCTAQAMSFDNVRINKAVSVVREIKQKGAQDGRVV